MKTACQIPSEFAACEVLSNAYRSGWNSGHGIACHNVPSIGDRIDPCVDYVGVGKRVTADNIREYHELLCFAAESNGRQFSPFEFTAKEINDLDEGGFVVFDPDDNAVSRHDTDDEAKAELARVVRETAQAEGLTEDEAREGWQIKDVPSAEETWEAYDQGVADAIRADLAGYTDQDYGIESDENDSDPDDPAVSSLAAREHSERTQSDIPAPDTQADLTEPDRE